jgi:trehalose 6-phosphate synthase
MATLAQQPSLLSPITREDLGELKLHLPTLKVISYRGPGESGAVPASLEPLTRQLDAKIHWIALSGLPSENNSPVLGFTFYRAELPESLVERHERACLEYLWPLLHGMPEKAKFDSDCWRAFRQLSQQMAAESLRIASQSFPTLYWMHDYQMVLVAPHLSLEAGSIPCHFWHVPWPSPNIMSTSPVAVELVESLLCNKLVGFHTTEYATNFLDTVQEVIPEAVVDVLKMEIRSNHTTTRVVVMPLGLDFAYWTRLSRTNRPRAAAIPKKYKLANQLVLGIDRLDYSKGILEKLNGLDNFLANNPTWQRRFHYVQLAQPPQSPSADFEGYVQLVNQKVDEINRKYHSDGWEPILWIQKQFDHGELAAWYQTADVLAVTPVRDGLNLIAKEYVACRQDEQGVLVLSRQAGCADELTVGALLIDPQNPVEISKAIAKAFSMTFEEKRRRMLAMRHVVNWNQLHDWACGFLRQAIRP